MTFTPNAHFFNFYLIQHQWETLVHWVLFPIIAYGVYKLFKAMTR